MEMCSGLSACNVGLGRFFKPTRHVFDLFAPKSGIYMSIHLNLIDIYYYPRWHVYC